MTDEKIESEEIIAELHSAIDGLISGCETLDMKAACESFHDTPEFLMMGTDGSLCDYQTYVKNNIDYFSGCARFKLTTFDRKATVIDTTTAVYSWAYGVEAKLKNGKTDIIENAGASFFFRKIDGTWKVVYYHESSVPPKQL